MLQYRLAGGAQDADSDRRETRRPPWLGRAPKCSEGAGLVNTARQSANDIYQINGCAPLVLASGGRVQG